MMCSRRRRWGLSLSAKGRSRTSDRRHVKTDFKINLLISGDKVAKAS
jgi:hypothetical protein